jgi:uncharacterized protein YjbI with pentapeptide repeats
MRSAERTETNDCEAQPRRPRSGIVRTATRLAPAVIVLIAGILCWARPTSAAAAECESMSLVRVQAADLVVRIDSGEPVFLSCVVVEGDLRITPDMGEVGPIYIIESVFEGGVVAPFVRFSGPVHFDGTCFRGDLNIEGAVFEDEVNWARASFACEGSSARVLASASRFHLPADLRAEVFTDVDFTDASFAARTLLGVEFRGEAIFRGALFEDQTSFRGAVFSQFANFENVTALSDVDFSSTEFHDDALFRRFSTPSRLSLRDSDFGADLNLDRASISNLDMSRAEFETLHMADISATTLSMTPPLVQRIEDKPTRTEVLRAIERSAKAQDDTGLANSALFERESLATRERPQPQRSLWLGIELVTGYLVRPVRPLIAMFVVALIGTSVRLLLDRRLLLAGFRRMAGIRPLPGRPLVEHRPQDPGTPNRSSWHIVALIATPAAKAFNAAINPRPPHPDIDETDGASYAIASLVWTEYLVQKVLLVVFLISLGNANPTIRQIITSIV